MSDHTPSELREAARATRRRANAMLREAQQMEREAQAKEASRVVFDSDGATLTVTQAQLHFIHTKAFEMEHGDVQVQREGKFILVQAGDERHYIDETATIDKTEGYDPFDNDWTTK